MVGKGYKHIMLLMSLCSEYRVWVNTVVLNILVLCSIWDIREVDVDFNRDTFFSLHNAYNSFLGNSQHIYELIHLQLFKTHCLPLLTYGICVLVSMSWIKLV